MAKLSLSLSGEDVNTLFSAVADDPFFGFEGESAWTVDSKDVSTPIDWKSSIPRDAKQSAMGYFNGFDRLLALEVGWCVKAKRPWLPNADELLAVIARLPCELISVATLHSDWLRVDALRLPVTMFGYAHYPYAAFASFKGNGHAHLVSRRWLTHGGPWLLHRGPNDTSLLQLHDLDADSPTANAQVRKAQERLGPGETGGYIGPGFKRTLKHDVQYSGRDRKATIVVAKREVTPLEMLEAATLRGSDVLGADSPIDSVAFVYLDEGQARRDLHELWLRELECWTYIDGRETRIDDSYDPPAPPKPW